MLELVTPQSHPFQKPEKDNSPDKSSSKVARPDLKLVVSNPDPMGTVFSKEMSSTKKADTLCSFTVEVRMIGSYLYEMTIHDPAHYLKCDLMLEVEEALDETNSGSVICHFPSISDEELNHFVEEDETLYGMLMIQFQIQILEQLLLFCATHYASTLVIFADDDQADALGIYQDFLRHRQLNLNSLEYAPLGKI